MKEETSKDSNTFKCPQCGAPLNPRQADCFVACTHCGSSLFLDLDALMPVATFHPTIPEKESPLHVRRHLAELTLDMGILPGEPELVYIPFWEEKNDTRLRRACAIFPELSITKPAARRQIFLPENQPPGSIILALDTQPEESVDRRLVYIPFYRIFVSHRKKAYHFLCNAVSGSVYGPSIPREPDRRISGLFRLFAGIFLVILAFDVAVDTPWALIALNTLLFILAYQVSLPWIETHLYR